jgi:hypothetical protein
VNRRVAAFVALWCVVAAGLVVAPGCYGRNCEGDSATFGAAAGEGRMTSETRWESNPIDEPWIPFPRQRYFVFDIRALGGRVPRTVEVLVSGHPNPNKEGRDYTIGSGNLALQFNRLPNRVDLKNDSCSDYFLHLVVDVDPFPPPTDAGLATPEISDASTAPDAADASIRDATDQ